MMISLLLSKVMMTIQIYCLTDDNEDDDNDDDDNDDDDNDVDDNDDDDDDTNLLLIEGLVLGFRGEILL